MSIGELKFLYEQMRQIRAEGAFFDAGVIALGSGTAGKDSTIIQNLQDDLELKPIVLTPKVSSRQQQMEFASAVGRGKRA